MYAWLVMGVSTSLFFLLSLSAFVRYFAGLECDGQKPRGQSTAMFRLLGTGTLISAASALASLATWRVMQLRAVDESIGFFRLVGMLCLGMSATGLWALPGPVLLTWTLMKWSGAPTIEGRLKRKKPGYEEYVRRTSGFLPWFPKAG